jgi:hypothetical protein
MTIMTATIRKTLLTVGLGLAAPLAVAAMLSSTPADAQTAVKTGCPNKLTAKCPKGTHRVCAQTDGKGCCKSSKCEKN